MVALYHSFYKLVLLYCAAESMAACTRPVLQSALDSLIQTVEKSAGASMKFAPGAKITQNNSPISSIREAKIVNFTSWGKPYKINVLDEEACTTASMRVPKINDQLELLSSRMKITPSGEVLELEFHTAGKGSHSLFKPDSLPNEAPAMWSTDSPASHSSLIKAINSYPEGISRGMGEITQASSSCNRFENGQVMGVGICNKFSKNSTYPVEFRRFYADTKTGAGLGSFLFSTLGNSTRKARGFKALWLHEYFKVDQEQIQQIVAVMNNVDDNWKDAWATL
jgi:hypothetical protein